MLSYLSEFAAPVASLLDLYAAVCSLPDEEELSAFRCREGVAISHASDGWWILFTDDPGPDGEGVEHSGNDKNSWSAQSAGALER